MKTKLQKHLATLAPSVSIVTLWEHDPDARFDELTAPGCAFENENPDAWNPWQSEIRAAAIVNGETVTGEEYLGGTWEKVGDNPAESNPDISGYELQMTQEALCSLAAGIEPTYPVQSEISRALDWLGAEAGRRYDEQHGNVVPPTP